jgi:hypothetical protein
MGPNAAHENGVGNVVPTRDHRFMDGSRRESGAVAGEANPALTFVSDKFPARGARVGCRARRRRCYRHATVVTAGDGIDRE